MCLLEAMARKSDAAAGILPSEVFLTALEKYLDETAMADLPGLDGFQPRLSGQRPATKEPNAGFWLLQV